MKKVLLLAAVVALGFTSCSKGDYTCTCTSSYAGVSSSAETTYKKVKKDDAKIACESGNYTSSYGGTVTCTLKDA